MADRPILVFVLEPRAGARFHELASQFDCDINRNEILSMESGAISPIPQITIVDHAHASWLEELSASPCAYHVIYIRPTVMQLVDVIAHSYEGLDSRRDHLRAARFLDVFLSRFDVLNVETLYADAARASDAVRETLERLSGRGLTSMRVAELKENYDSSFKNFLNALSTGDSGDLGFFPRLMPNKTYKVPDPFVTELIVGRGWSRAEKSHMWSDGDTASLRLPLPASSDLLRCEIQGYVVSGQFSVAVYVEGSQVGLFAKSAADGRGITMDVPVTLAAVHERGDVWLEFKFSGTVRPSDVGLNGDRRQLGLALMSLRLYSVAGADGDRSWYEDVARRLRDAGHVAEVRGEKGELGFCVLLCGTNLEDLHDAVAYCANAKCALLVVLGADFHELDYPWAVCIPKDLDVGIALLDELKLTPDTMLLWNPKAGDDILAVITSRLREAKFPGCRILLKTRETAVLEPLQHLLRNHSEVVIVDPEFITIEPKNGRASKGMR